MPRIDEYVANNSNFTAQPITTAEAARVIGVSARTLEGRRSKQLGGPPFTRLGPRLARYDYCDVLAWLVCQKSAA